MNKIESAKKFVASLSERELSDDELLHKFGEFFEDNCVDIDAEFLNKLFEAKADGLNIGFDLMEEYAYKGSPAAQLAIGALKLEGRGVPKNIHEGIFWLKRAYIGQNPNAGFLLCDIYANGIGVKENMEKARDYLKTSADLGVPKSQYFFAMMLLEGEGGAIEEDTAMGYMLNAAENGYEKAVEFLEENNIMQR